jgi:hypothetical protein
MFKTGTATKIFILLIYFLWQLKKKELKFEVKHKQKGLSWPHVFPDHYA